MRPDDLLQILTVSGTSLLLALVLTPAVRGVARHLGAVAAPKADRWHKKPTAMMGGVAIFLAVVLGLLFLEPKPSQLFVVVGASAALFLLGLIDDFLHIKPYQKLVGQVMAAGVVVYFGLVLPWTVSPLTNMLITFVWVVGITNAVNMLDNMDGLAVGISAIAAIFLAITFFFNGQFAEALMLAGFTGALVGFLVYNHAPASIFMGDCGSMFVGFFLAASALLAAAGGGGRSRSVVAVLAVPVLVLCIPIFDTTFVTLMRKLAGRAASRGGRDHTSHRLVALGLSEKHAVWMMYVLAISAGSIALMARDAALDVSIAAIGSFVVILTFLGVHLARVRVYSEEELAAAREKPLVSFLFGLTHKHRIFEVALDAGLISLSYYVAYLMRFGPFDWSINWQLFLKTLPVVIVIKLAVFLGSGVYRSIWRYMSLTNVMGFARAVALSSVLTILAVVYAFRFEGFSRSVFLLDGLLLLVFVTASRFTFKLLHRLLPSPHMKTGKRVAIYGAGDAGELLCRELINNSGLEIVPVAFIDDDPAKTGRLIHGLRVHSSAQSLEDLAKRLNIQEVFISTSKLSPERLATIVANCATAGLPITRAYMAFQRLNPGDLEWTSPTAPVLAAVGLRKQDDAPKPSRPTARAVTDH